MKQVKTAYLSVTAPKQAADYLVSVGYRIWPVHPISGVSPEIASHPDIVMCKMGVHETDEILHAADGALGEGYPKEAAYDAVCLERYCIHNLQCIAPEIRNRAEALGKELIHVRQGYTKCNTVVVDGCSVITADPGIAGTLRQYPDLDVLQVATGHVMLRGYSYGFLGGTSGRIGSAVLFCGDLERHPDYIAIRRFVEARRLKLVYFPTFPLQDVGSVITGYSDASCDCIPTGDLVSW